jgi:hypothetical protein
MNRDRGTRLDVDPLRRLVDENGQRATRRHEHFLLIRLEMSPGARLRRIAPHLGS